MVRNPSHGKIPLGGSSPLPRILQGPNLMCQNFQGPNLPVANLPSANFPGDQLAAPKFTRCPLCCPQCSRSPIFEGEFQGSNLPRNVTPPPPTVTGICEPFFYWVSQVYPLSGYSQYIYARPNVTEHLCNVRFLC